MDPAEPRMYDLSEQYYSIKDPTAKRMFLSINPALQNWFVQQRTKRYETFLNQVAVYMGSNLELFTNYLERQADVLSDLLPNLAYRPTVSAQSVIRAQQTDTRRHKTDARRG